MLTALKTSAAVKIAGAIAASTAIGVTAVAGPEILPFVDGDAAVSTDDGTGVDAELGVDPDADADVDGSLDVQLESDADAEASLDTVIDLG